MHTSEREKLARRRWMTRWTALLWFVGFWGGFWTSGFGWANPYVCFAGSFGGVGLLLVAVVAIREDREDS